MKAKTALLIATAFMTFNAYAAISRDKAEAIALRQVPGAQISGGGLEKAQGRDVWTFDLSTQSSKNFTEVVIDAESGKVLSVRVETPADQVGKTQPL
jgi:uncharacterized membrane protein YkoI